MRIWILGLFFSTLAGCGGNVVVDGGATNGGAPATGVGGAGGAAGTSHANTVAHATAAGPTSDAAVTNVASSTNVVASSGTSLTTSASSSSTSMGTGGGLPDCSTLPYAADRAPCSVDQQQCSMPLCCGGVLECVGGAWHATAPPCSRACITCGEGVACDAAAVCVEDQVADIEVYYRCAKTACPRGAPACSCDEAACTDYHLSCIGDINDHLGCTDGTR